MGLAVLTGELAGAVSRRTGRGRGSTLPGRVALRLVPDLLVRLARDRTLLLVSGTNGKSTTTRYLAAALATCGQVVTNLEGANMHDGLATTLMRRGADVQAPVVLEVDERALVSTAAALHPSCLVLLNLTRDQLDRTGEVSEQMAGWAAALRSVPGSQVVANADDPLVCAAVLAARPDARAVRWVGAGQPWRHDSPLCPVCWSPWPVHGRHWGCRRCGFARPTASWQLTGNVLHVPGRPPLALRLRLPGRANLANAAMACAAAAVLGVPAGDAASAMGDVADVDGRYLTVLRGPGQVRLLLVKNPAGWVEVLDQLEDQPGRVVVAVNAREADGTDTSWLWDVPFERLRGRRVVAAGERSADLSLRLLYADVHHVREPDALRAVDLLSSRRTHVLANYTAFIRVRDQLSTTGHRAAGSVRLVA